MLAHGSKGARKELKGGVVGASDPGSMGVGPCVVGPTINPSSTVLQREHRTQAGQGIGPLALSLTANPSEQYVRSQGCLSGP